MYNSQEWAEEEAEEEVSFDDGPHVPGSSHCKRLSSEVGWLVGESYA